MGDLTKDFSRQEFACKCGCGFDRIDPRVVDMCQVIRDKLGAPVRINSACRCEKPRGWLRTSLARLAVSASRQ